MKAKPRSLLFQLQREANDGTHKCEKCGRTQFLTVDHIIPKYILEQLGFGHDMLQNYLDNLEYLCKWCNQMKSCRLDVQNPKTLPLMRKFMIMAENELMGSSL